MPRMRSVSESEPGHSPTPWMVCRKRRCWMSTRRCMRTPKASSEKAILSPTCSDAENLTVPPLSLRATTLTFNRRESSLSMTRPATLPGSRGSRYDGSPRLRYRGPTTGSATLGASGLNWVAIDCGTEGQKTGSWNQRYVSTVNSSISRHSCSRSIRLTWCTNSCAMRA